MSKKSRGSGFISDFRAFIKRGNVIDLAVAIIIGTAFTAIVSSLVKDIIMPFISALLGNSDFTTLTWNISDTLVISYGNFLKAVIDFLLIALVVFTVIRVLTKTERRIRKSFEKKNIQDASTPAAPVETTDDILKDIRELLKVQNKK